MSGGHPHRAAVLNSSRAKMKAIAGRANGGSPFMGSSQFKRAGEHGEIKSYDSHSKGYHVEKPVGSKAKSRGDRFARGGQVKHKADGGKLADNEDLQRKMEEVTRAAKRAHGGMIPNQSRSSRPKPKHKGAVNIAIMTEPHPRPTLPAPPLPGGATGAGAAPVPASPPPAPPSAPVNPQAMQALSAIAGGGGGGGGGGLLGSGMPPGGAPGRGPFAKGGRADGGKAKHQDIYITKGGTHHWMDDDHERGAKRGGIAKHAKGGNVRSEPSGLASNLKAWAEYAAKNRPPADNAGTGRAKGGRLTGGAETGVGRLEKAHRAKQ